MGVPCVSSAQMKTHSLPMIFCARTKTSVCTDSTMWPRWMLPLAYGSAWVTSNRFIIGLGSGLRAPGKLPGAHFRQKVLHCKPRVGAVLQFEIDLGATDEHLAPEAARLAAGALV